jgi:hypothetical protein
MIRSNCTISRVARNSFHASLGFASVVASLFDAATDLPEGQANEYEGSVGLACCKNVLRRVLLEDPLHAST